MIVVDVETSGIDPINNQILSIGAVDLNFPDKNFYGECKLSENKTYQDEALKINGFRIEEIDSNNEKLQNLTDLMEKFVTFVKDSDDFTMAGQNISFDSSFLKQAEKETGKTIGFSHRFFDMHSFAYGLLIKEGYEIPTKNGKDLLSLDAISILVGIPEEPKPHNGLNGALQEAEVISRLLFNKNIIEDFASYPLITLEKGYMAMKDKIEKDLLTKSSDGPKSNLKHLDNGNLWLSGKIFHK